jgi:regulator of protease activity HflC (stomatin/prohibitin superfamily)
MEDIQGSNNQEQLNDQGLIKEKIIEATGGCKIIGLFFLCIAIQVVILVFMINSGVKKEILVGMLPFLVFFDFIAFILIIKGTFTNEINEAHIITFFGKYYGTVKNNGFLWINPFTSKSKMSLKARNLNGAVIKVNDKHGNPVMMGCVVVWRIFDTAKASFEVASCEEYIRIQSEGVVREVGCLFPYDKLSQEDTITLKGDQKEINRILVDLMSKRCMAAGIQIIEAKITELSYANEIAEVMLKTQAADAVIAARDKIVNGAVSMIGHALSSLDSNEICKMSREKKAKLVSNMLVVLCGESQNTSNVGSSASRLTEGIYKYR